MKEGDISLDFLFYQFGNEIFGVFPPTDMVTTMEEGVMDDGKEPMEDGPLERLAPEWLTQLPEDQSAFLFQDATLTTESSAHWVESDTHCVSESSAHTVSQGDDTQTTEENSLEWRDPMTRFMIDRMYGTEDKHYESRFFMEGAAGGAEIEFRDPVFEFGAASAKYPMVLATEDNPYTHYGGVENAVSCQVNFPPGTNLRCLSSHVIIRSLDHIAMVKSACSKGRTKGTGVARPHPVDTTACTRVHMQEGNITVRCARVRPLVDILPKSYTILHQIPLPGTGELTGYFRVVFMFELMHNDGHVFHLIVESPRCKVQGKRRRDCD
jgi:hypothetical protein